MSATSANSSAPSGGAGKHEPRNPIQITSELEEVMKRVSDLKNVAGMVVVNSEGKCKYRSKIVSNQFDLSPSVFVNWPILIPE